MHLSQKGSANVHEFFGLKNKINIELIDNLYRRLLFNKTPNLKFSWVYFNKSRSPV